MLEGKEGLVIVEKIRNSINYSCLMSGVVLKMEKNKLASEEISFSTNSFNKSSLLRFSSLSYSYS